MSVQTSQGHEVLDAVAAVDVEQLPALREASSAGAALAEQADRIDVTDAISAQTATALLGQVVSARRHAEAQRVALTRPLNDVVKKINAAAKATTEPLASVEARLKLKLLVYQREQQRLAEVERARLEAEAERRRVEEAEQMRAAEEAARLEREAAERAANAARDEQARREREESDVLSAKIRAASDEDLDDLVARGSERLVELARTELGHRRVARAAERAASEARARESAALDAAPLPIVAPAVSAPARLEGGGASVSVRKRWTYELEDFAAVPDAYKELAKGAVLKAVREGVREIPGLRIFQTDDASVSL